jgi:hypothetical protein
MDFSKLCTPALVYLVISVITIVVGIFTDFHIVSLLIKAFFVALWTWFLNYLCSKGYKIISWVLVLLPFLVMLGVLALATEVVSGVVKKTSVMMPLAQVQQPTPQQKALNA